MPTAPAQTLEAGFTLPINVALFANDGETLDTTSSLAFQFNTSLLEVALDPANNRRVLVKAKSGGTTVQLVINRAGAVVNQPLIVPLTLQHAVDRSKVDFVNVEPAYRAA